MDSNTFYGLATCTLDFVIFQSSTGEIDIIHRYAQFLLSSGHTSETPPSLSLWNVPPTHRHTQTTCTLPVKCQLLASVLFFLKH